MKVGIIGAGHVGSAAANALVLRGLCTEVILLDKDDAKADAQARDLNDAAPLTHPTHVTSGTYHDLRDAAAVVIAAGIEQKPGQSRLELTENDAAALRDIVPRALDAARSAVIVIAAKPVNLMTALAARLAGNEAHRVLGTGTVLETARLRSEIAAHAGVEPRHVHAYVIGDQGAASVPVWSGANIGGLPLEAHYRARDLEFTHATRNDITARVKYASTRVLEGKGVNSYGIGASIARILEAIVYDSRTILTVSATSEQRGVPLALPRLIGRAGVLATLEQPLSDSEELALEATAGALRDALERL